MAFLDFFRKGSAAESLTQKHIKKQNELADQKEDRKKILADVLRLSDEGGGSEFAARKKALANIDQEIEILQAEVDQTREKQIGENLDQLRQAQVQGPEKLKALKREWRAILEQIAEDAGRVAAGQECCCRPGEMPFEITSTKALADRVGHEAAELHQELHETFLRAKVAYKRDNPQIADYIKREQELLQIMRLRPERMRKEAEVLTARQLRHARGEKV